MAMMVAQVKRARLRGEACNAVAISRQKVAVRERRYIAARSKGMTQAEAAIKAGFKGRDPKQAGWLIERRPRVKARLQRIETDALLATGISRAQIVRELARVAMLDPRQILDEFGNVKDFDQIDGDTAAALAGMEVEELFEGSGQERRQTGMVRKVKFWNKVEALKELSKIARLVQDAPVAAPAVGPGLQVIVQQVVGGGPQVVAQRIEVNLPGPGMMGGDNAG